jgi:hypothetical protein
MFFSSHVVSFTPAHIFLALSPVLQAFFTPSFTRFSGTAIFLLSGFLALLTIAQPALSIHVLLHASFGYIPDIRFSRIAFGNLYSHTPHLLSSDFVVVFSFSRMTAMDLSLVLHPHP